MVWQPTVYSFLGFGAVVLCIVIVGQAWENRDERGARSFLGMVLVGAGWSLVYGIQLGFSTLPEQLLWQRAGIAMSGAIPPLLFLFTLEYAGLNRWLSRWMRVVLVAEPLAFAVLSFTNPAHRLIWTEANLVETMGGSVLDLTLGPGYYAHVVYAYLLVVVSLGLIFHVFTQESRIYRRQSTLLMMGFVPPFVSHVGFALGAPFGPLSGLDPTPFVFVATGTLLVLSLFEFDLLERKPVARQHVIEDMGDGLAVLDADGRVVDMNGVAREVFGAPSDDLGSVDEMVPDGAGTVQEALETLDGRTMTATVNGGERFYDVNHSPLVDHRGETVSHVVSLRDITDRKEHEQRLEVANRVLRHNLRNDMNVILGRAERLAKGDADDREREARDIVETAENLVDLSEKARTVSRIEGDPTGGGVAVDVPDRVGDIVEGFRGRYPGVRIEYETPDEAEISAGRTELLDIPVRNLIENAIEHNDSDDPLVRVVVERRPDEVLVRIEDNGEGIPDTEREVFEEGTETPLEHGSGMGLWLTHWSVRTVGGEVEFDGGSEAGNAVTLRFPTR